MTGLPVRWLSQVKSCSCLPCIAMVRAWDEAKPIETEDRPHNTLDLTLTAKEVTILQLVARGLANKEIAANLSLAEATIKNRLSVMFAKMQVLDRTQAAIMALDLGLVTR